MMLNIFSRAIGCIFIRELLSNSFVHFLIVSLSLSYKTSLCFMDYGYYDKFLVRYIIFKPFLPFCALSFLFLDVSFETQRFLILITSSLFFFPLAVVLLMLYLRNHCKIQVHEDLLLYVLLIGFLLCFVFTFSYCVRIIIHFNLIFCMWSEVDVLLYSFARMYPTVLASFVKRTVISLIGWYWYPYQKS